MKLLMIFTLILAAHANAEFKVAIDQTYEKLAPYVMEDFKEAYQRIGIEAQLHYLPGERAVQMAKSGNYQALDMRFLNADLLTELVAVDEPLFVTAKVYAYRKKGSDIFIDSISQLNEYAIAYAQTTQYRKTLKALNPDQKEVIAHDFNALLKLLRYDRVELILLSDVLYKHYSKQDLTNDIEPASTALFEENMYHLIHKDHQDLAPKLKAEIQKMKLEGKFKPR